MKMNFFTALSRQKNDCTNFPFSDKPNTACFTCSHVLEEHKPILYVSHDEDGYWSFLCGGSHTEKEMRLVALSEILDIDGSMTDLAGLDYGQYAEAEEEKGNCIVGRE